MYTSSMDDEVVFGYKVERMKYRIETELDPCLWSPQVLVAMRDGAIKAKNQLLSKQETDKLLKRLNVVSHCNQYKKNNNEPDYKDRTK